MKSTEVYKIARGVLSPWCKANGFKRTRGGMLGWTKPVGDRHLIFWLQVSQSGWDAYAGSKFTVEFQLSTLERPGAHGKDCFRSRIARFLDRKTLEEVLGIQNDVIKGLPNPPSSHPVILMGGSTESWYRRQFELEKTAYDQLSDIWCRYHTPEDVRRWVSFLLTVIPRILASIVEDAKKSAPKSL